jgi:hypothetical protein
VIADGLCIDAEMVQQLARVTRVFTCNQIDFPQDSQGPLRDVFKIPDWCRDDVKSAGHVGILTLTGRVRTPPACFASKARRRRVSKKGPARR